MAEKRMFSKTIIDSDVFIDMPLSTQALYFHLAMRADDEGFINNPKKVMRMIGANQNELEILLAKRYLLSFESGVVVVKHWKMHNAIRLDRMKDTMYSEEKGKLITKENGSYSFAKTVPQPNDNQMATKCPHRLDKISIDKNRKEEDPKKITEKYNPVDHLRFFNDTDFQESWMDFIQVRQKKKASRTERALKILITKLKELSGNNKVIAIAILDKSSQSGWSNIYSLKDDEKKILKVPTRQIKVTNTDRYNKKKLLEQNPEEYTNFNPEDLMSIIKKVSK